MSIAVLPSEAASAESRAPAHPFPESIDLDSWGERMSSLVRDLFPVCRSITGNGLRETLRRVALRIPLEIHEVPSETSVFDWTVPKEWNIRDAWVKNAAGERVIDFRKSSLHVVSYSTPIHRRMSLAELRPHLHTLPDNPDWIPYRTSYYRESWGFCLSENVLRSLPEGEYEVCIDSTLEPGSLSYGECYLPGRRREEVLITSHACHPALANDNLSGIALNASLAELLDGVALEYSYRFLFMPGTIGSITWLARNEERASRIKHGIVAACVGDTGAFHYKKSRRGDAEVDRAAALVLAGRPEGYDVREFSPYGYDERQFCSPGFNLPVGCFSRTPHGRFPEYHTSADNLDFVRPAALAGSLDACLSVIRVLEGNARYLNLNPKCEPQLGRRGLFSAMGGYPNAGQLELALLWVLNLSDGEHWLLDIAERSGLPFDLLKHASRLLVAHGLLREMA